MLCNFCNITMWPIQWPIPVLTISDIIYGYFLVWCNISNTCRSVIYHSRHIYLTVYILLYRFSWFVIVQWTWSICIVYCFPRQWYSHCDYETSSILSTCSSALWVVCILYLICDIIYNLNLGWISANCRH